MKTALRVRSALLRMLVRPGMGCSIRLISRVLSIAAIFAPLCNGQTVEKVAPPAAKQQAKPSETAKPAETEKNAAQIELLETKYRFESNGDSRKEVHARVRINNELGVRQFARLNFDFNRSFQSVEIPLVRVTHTSGGVQDILPSAITDNPNPAVVDAPAYQDVRVKSVRVLGIQPGDLLEYRVITATTHHPLAPDFWLEHTFDRAGIVSEEHFEIDLPASRRVQLHVATQYAHTIDESENSKEARVAYRWIHPKPKTPTPALHHSLSESQVTDLSSISSSSEADVVLSTFEGWSNLSTALGRSLNVPMSPSPEIAAKAKQLTGSLSAPSEQLAAVYDFVSKSVRTIDLPLGSTGFRLRPPAEILAASSAIPEEKCALLSALAWAIHIPAATALAPSRTYSTHDLALPSVFTRALVVSRLEKTSLWLDPVLEVAPFGAISAALRGKPAFLLAPPSDIQFFENIPSTLPYPSTQRVSVDSAIAIDGKLTAKVKYALRGDNELLLRVAFHQTPRDKWREIAQLLAISDGFRGEITRVTASDPYVTNEPFQVEYEISQPKFVDWSRKLVRIPALLPAPGLPEASSPATGSAGQKSIDLGTPLEIDLEATVQLPEETAAQAPIGTSVERDYATFSSKYGVMNAEYPAKNLTITASRKLRFIAQEIPAARAGDLRAFLHAVQADQTQLFTLQRTTSPEK